MAYKKRRLAATSFRQIASDSKQLHHSGQRSALGIQALFIGIVMVTVSLAMLLVRLHYFLPQTTTLSAELLIEAYRWLVFPEPTERFVFTILAAVVPIIAFVLTAVSASPKTAEYFNKITSRRSIAAFAPLIVALLLFAPFVGSNFLSTLFGKYNTVYLVLPLCSALSLLWCFWETSEVTPRPLLPNNTFSAVIWLIFINSVLLQTLSWRFLGINSVTESGTWSGHADAVFYSLSQVVAGKTLLVDLPSQYGLWAEMLAPLFRITGLSVLGLSSLFAILQLISLCSLFFVLSKLVRIPSLRMMGGIALVMATFGTWALFLGINDPYFQYWPIRFFWPAVSVLAFYRFSRNKTLLRSAFMSFMGAVGFLWNADSGLFIVVVYGAFLAAKLTVLVLYRLRPAQANKDSWTARQYVSAIVAHVGITVFVVVVFLGVLILKSGGLLNLSRLFEYQKIVYRLGFMMRPLPRQIDPWMSVLGVYLLGLLASLHSWIFNSARKRMDTVFYLSMLGLGLFVYYQGRSVVLVLACVCWPVVMLAVILADESVRAIRARILPMTQIFLPAAAVSLFFVCCFSFVSHGTLMFTGVKKKLSLRGTTETSLAMNELAFIMQYATPKHECLILSKRQGIYYAESGLASPLKGPGLVEMLLKADQDRLIAQVLNGSIQCLFLGIGGDTDAGLKLDAQKMREKYSIVATNSKNTMQYLEPKP